MEVQFISVNDALPQPHLPVVAKIRTRDAYTYHVCKFNGEIDWRGSSAVYSHAFAEGQNNVVAWFYVPLEEKALRTTPPPPEVTAIPEFPLPGQNFIYGGYVVECTVGSVGGCCINCVFKQKPEMCNDINCSPSERPDKLPVYLKNIRPV